MPRSRFACHQRTISSTTCGVGDQRYTGSANVASLMKTSHSSCSNGAQVGIRLPFVVAGHDPDLPVVLDAHLRGAENVPGGMQRNARRAELKRRAVVHGRDGVPAAQPMLGDGARRDVRECSARCRGGDGPHAHA